MLKIKLDKKAFSNYMENLVGRRYENSEKIERDIYDNTNIKIKLDFDEIWNEEERSEDYDYCLKSNLTVNDEDLCYVDIYFIKDNGGRMYITEINLDFNT